MEKNSFDQYADNYRQIHTKNVQGISGESSDYFSEYKIQELYTMFDFESDVKFLDLGCGDGNSAKYIKKYFPECAYWGLDVSAESIQIAQSRGLSQCVFEQYDGNNIPYENETFDVVFMACVLHHVEESEHIPLLKEVKRVLKKTGLVIIFEHNPYNPLTQKVVKDCPFDEGVILISAKKMHKLLKDAGFYDGIKTRYTIFFPRKGIFKKMLSIEKRLYWCPLGGQYYCIGK